MPKLTRDEMATFLEEPGHLARIGTVDDDGMPRVLPLWFIVEDGALRNVRMRTCTYARRSVAKDRTFHPRSVIVAATLRACDGGRPDPSNLPARVVSGTHVE
jgi:hypothetical protein